MVDNFLDYIITYAKAHAAVGLQWKLEDSSICLFDCIV